MTTEAGFRRFLLTASAATFAAAGVELGLVEHWEAWTQWIAFGLVAAGVLAVAWAGRGSRAALRALRVVAFGIAVGSGVGVGLHVRGNMAFAREVAPGLGLGEALWEGLSGGSPLLAPGMLALASGLAAAATWRHPALAGPSETEPPRQGSALRRA